MTTINITLENLRAKAALGGEQLREFILGDGKNRADRVARVPRTNAKRSRGAVQYRHRYNARDPAGIARGNPRGMPPGGASIVPPTPGPTPIDTPKFHIPQSTIDMDLKIPQRKMIGISDEGDLGSAAADLRASSVNVRTGADMNPNGRADPDTDATTDVKPRFRSKK